LLAGWRAALLQVRAGGPDLQRIGFRPDGDRDLNEANRAEVLWAVQYDHDDDDADLEAGAGPPVGRVSGADGSVEATDRGLDRPSGVVGVLVAEVVSAVVVRVPAHHVADSGPQLDAHR
jgi:hypothetical protein